MTLVSNDPGLWPLINLWRVSSYLTVVASTAVFYDWALTFGQEFELVWRQRWSFMTVLYIGTLFWNNILWYHNTVYAPHNSASIFLTGVSQQVSQQFPSQIYCAILYLALSWINFITITALGAVIITRLHAMYQRSRNMLFFLVVIFFAVTIACGVLIGKMSNDVIGEELVLSGTYQCADTFEGDAQLLIAETWILITVWEVLALFLAVWIVIRHVHEIRQSSRGWTIKGFFAVLIKTHVLYFAAFGAVSCLTLSSLASRIFNLSSVGAVVYNAVLQFITLVQMFVLGPRLILSIREYYARLMATSEEETGMTTIAFQEHIQVSTSDGV